MPTFIDPDPLDGFALREGRDIRPTLLESLVKLYVQKPFHTAEEERHFTELTLRLLDHAGDAARAAVARQLAAYPATPTAIWRRLVDAAPIAWATTAARSDQARRRGEDGTKPVQQHSPAALAETFFAATADERRLILLNLADGLPAAEPMLASPQAARHLEAAALARDVDGFVRALARRLGVSAAFAQRIVRDPLGEPIVVAAKALGLAPETLQRILLCLNPTIAGSVRLVHELSALFEALDADAACALVGLWRAADPREARTGSQAPTVNRRPARENVGRSDPPLRGSTRPDRTRSRA
jgi:hypothetical protein